MYLKSLYIRLLFLGHNYPDVATSYNNIELVYKNQGKHDEALSMYQKSLKTKLSVIGHKI